MNTQIDYLSQYGFGHSCCRVKQGKRLSKFVQKYTDYGTETSQLAGYNIVVLNMEKYFCGPASTFHRGNQKSDIL